MHPHDEFELNLDSPDQISDKVAKLKEYGQFLRGKALQLQEREREINYPAASRRGIKIVQADSHCVISYIRLWGSPDYVHILLSFLRLHGACHATFKMVH